MSSFRIWSTKPRLDFRAELGDGPALVTAGYGGIEITARAGRTGITTIGSREPFQVTIPFEIDYWREQANKPGPDGEEGGIWGESMALTLEKLAGFGSSEGPPPVRVNGYGMIPHDYRYHPHWYWYIEDLSWDGEREIRYDATHRRARAGGSIVVRRIAVGVRLDLDDRSPAQKNRDKKKKKGADKNKNSAKSMIYVVKRGDTLTGIAAHELGKAKLWRKIADLNNIRDPHSITVGQRLKMPKD